MKTARREFFCMIATGFAALFGARFLPKEESGYVRISTEEFPLRDRPGATYNFYALDGEDWGRVTHVAIPSSPATLKKPTLRRTNP